MEIVFLNMADKQDALMRKSVVSRRRLFNEHCLRRRFRWP
jgi:hypothetical protein